MAWVPASYYRGGTSKAVIFLASDLDEVLGSDDVTRAVGRNAKGQEGDVLASLA